MEETGVLIWILLMLTKPFAAMEEPAKDDELVLLVKAPKEEHEGSHTADTAQEAAEAEPEPEPHKRRRRHLTTAKRVAKVCGKYLGSAIDRAIVVALAQLVLGAGLAAGWFALRVVGVQFGA